MYLCDIQSRVDCARWFGFDQFKACLIATLVSVCNIQSQIDHAHWYGIDCLRACLIATLVSVLTFRAEKIVPIGLASIV